MNGHPETWECPECGATLDISEVGFYKEVQCPGCAHSEIVHTRLANFQLTGILGIGGMSVVFKANDLILNRPLAIKVLNDNYKDQQERIARFENECAMMASVRHDNVVSVYSAGRSYGQFYIAMELVHGHDMEHTIRNGRPLSPTAALAVTREVALGLQAAARAGILHRDMKPGNILISQTNGKAKVLDFGLSLEARTEDTEEVIWATPFYVAPETLKRKQEDVRTDIYALGMTLRYLLTGDDKLPQEYASIADLLAIKKKLPSLGTVLPTLTREFIDLVDHMTAFAPDDRPPSYQELLQELDEVRDILSREEALKDPKRKAHRRKIRQICVGSTLFAGLAGAVIVADFSLPEPRQESLVVESYRDWGDVSLLQKGLDALPKAEWDGAKTALSAVNRDDAEPTIAAASALILYYLALTEGDDKGMEGFLKDLHRHVSREQECFSSAKQFFEQLKKTDGVLHRPHIDDDFSEVTGSMMRAVIYASMAEKEARRGEETMRGHIAGAKREFAQANAAFSKLYLRLDNIRPRVSQSTKKDAFAEIHKALQAHDFRQCDALLSEQEKRTNIRREDRDRTAAIREIRSVGELVVNVLQKRVPDIYRAGMSPEDMQSAAAKLNEQSWDKEVYCLALLMKGNYEAAFAADPYKDNTTSPRPFAVLMRHWHQMLRVGTANKKMTNTSQGTAAAER